METPSWMREGASPEQVLLDHESGLESTLSCGGCIFLVLAVVGWFVGGSLGELGAIGFLVGPVLWFLRFKLDDVHLLDYADKKVYFVRTFLGNRTQTRVCDFSDLFALAVKTSKQERKGEGPLYTHGLILVLRSGRGLPVSPENLNDLPALSVAAQAIATTLGIPYMPPPGNTYKLEIRPGGEPSIRYEPF